MTVLILQVRRLGDVLMTTPMLRALKGAIPGVVTHLCVDSASLPAVHANPHLDRVILSPGGASLGLVPALRRERYDVLIDTLGSPASASLAWLSGAVIRIGPNRALRRWWYTHPCEVRGHSYSAEEKLGYLAPLGVRSTDARIEVFPTEDECREADRVWDGLGVASATPVVGFSPVSRRSDKVWPAERFGEICDRWFVRAGVRYLPLYGPGEEAMVQHVVERARHRAAFLYPCPLVSFGALAPVLGRCTFYFGNDNAIRHVAIAAGIPTAAIFAHPDPRSWTPAGAAAHCVVGGRSPVETVSVDDADAMVARLVDGCRPMPERVS